MIQNIRRGFATNSSSTHSIIIVKDKSRSKDKLSDYFGWDFFTAKSNKAKRQYLASILYSHLSPLVGNTISIDLVKAWLDIDMTDDSLCLGIDHESMPTMPLDWDGKGIDKEFFEDYKDFILQKNLVILGGNDNTTKKHKLTRRYDPFVLPLIYDQRSNIVARKDPIEKYWTLFDKKQGTKCRVVFDKNQPIIKRSYIPELIDIKITDSCDKRCAYCYQDSKKTGEHADDFYLSQLIQTLGKLKVFEVALGGGDPLTFPRFELLLHNCNAAGVTVNFTSRDKTWLKDDSKRERILNQIGGFAYSVDSDKEICELGMLIEQYGIDKKKVQVQIVDGIISDWMFPRILKECSYHGLTLTILGFKRTGRADAFAKTRPPYQFDWIQMIKDAQKNDNYVTIGVDTVVAQQYQDRLREEGISDLFFTTQEGKFSCYIDAVKQQIGPSSYNPDQMINFSREDFDSLPLFFNNF